MSDSEKTVGKSDEEKLALREKHGINHDDFIVGFVFRNQLRKSVPNLLEGFNLFRNSQTVNFCHGLILIFKQVFVI